MTPGQRWYRSYLNTPHWWNVRRLAIDANGGRCANWWCRRRAVEVHHLTYANVGDEQPGDLRPLCKRCHRLAHRRWLAALWWTIRGDF